MEKKFIIALVGMPGSGKSEAAKYLDKKGIPVIRIGSVTDEGLQAQGLPLTEGNEKTFREMLREEMGMAAYAIKIEPKLHTMLEQHNIVALDGLYSWEEYTYLIAKFPQLKLIHTYTDKEKRYERLTTRAVRPLTIDEAKERDVAEIEKLNKGGPIAIADYTITNNTTLEDFEKQLDGLMTRIQL